MPESESEESDEECLSDDDCVSFFQKPLLLHLTFLLDVVEFILCEYIIYIYIYLSHLF